MKAYQLIAKHPNGKLSGLGNFSPLSYAERARDMYAESADYADCLFSFEPVEVEDGFPVLVPGTAPDAAA